MNSTGSDRIRSIRTEIENELRRHDEQEDAIEMAGLGDLLRSVTGGSEQQDPDRAAKASRAERKRHHTAMAVLLMRKITEECRIGGSVFSRQQIRAQLREDMTLFLQSVGWLDLQNDSEENVLCDGLDLLTAYEPGNEPVLKACCDKYIPERTRAARKFDAGTWFLFSFIAQALADGGETQRAGALLESLADRARVRDTEKDRAVLVAEIYRKLAGFSPETIRRIAAKETAAVNGYAEDRFYSAGLKAKTQGDFEQARDDLSAGLAIRRVLEGEHSWYADIAQRELALIEQLLDGTDHTAFLNSFVDRIMAHGYSEPIDPKIQTLNAAETIYWLLREQNEEIRDPERYRKLLDYYEAACRMPEAANDMLVSMRLARNFRAIYALRQGNFAEAEENFRSALEAEASEQTKEFLTDAQIKSNILLCLDCQNDIAEAEPLIDELLYTIETAPDALGENAELAVYVSILELTRRSFLELPPEYETVLQNALTEVSEKLKSDTDAQPELVRQRTTFFLQSVMWRLQQDDAIPADRMAELYDTCRALLENSEKYRMTSLQKVFLQLAAALLAFHSGNAAYGSLCREIIQACRNETIPEEARVSILGTAGIMLARRGMTAEGIGCIREELKTMEAVWHRYAAYINDERLAAALEPMQYSFLAYYSVLRREDSTENAYEALLCFKCPASLAGRERNRCLLGAEGFGEQLSAIRTLQNEIAAAETAEQFIGGEALLPEKRARLRELENRFVSEVPESLRFTEITWERVRNAIPDECAVLEYFWAGGDYGKTCAETAALPDSADVSVLDLYITTSRNGNVSMRRIEIPNGADVIDLAFEYVDILQRAGMGTEDNTADDTDEFRRNDICGKLYEALILPALDTIEGLRTIYIAPDSLLVNLPFELLCRERSERLFEEHQIVKIECARDFLFFTEQGPSQESSLVIGDPQYRRGGNAGSSGETRFMRLSETEISRLPYSGVEAGLAARRLGTVPMLGKQAVKKLVQNAAGVTNLHIATHGLFDLEAESNALFSSALAFSGAADWADTGKTDREYGNGLLTADEISRLDLRCAKLVTLSACMSGMSRETLQSGFRGGLVGAFAAAGAGYVITHLWAEPDSLGTVILLDAFYSYYAGDHITPPEALSMAKQYLRGLNVKQIREHRWFEYLKNADIPPEEKEAVSALEHMDDRYRPFKDEMQWGGFVCYRCN